MKITEEAPGVFSFKNGTAEEDAEIIRKARALLAERCPEALPDFERGVRLMYPANARSEAISPLVADLEMWPEYRRDYDRPPAPKDGVGGTLNEQQEKQDGR